MFRTTRTKTLGVALALVSCSNLLAASSDGYIKKPNKAQLQAQIDSFTDVAKQLHVANQSPNSTACEKLETVWTAIEESAQEPDALFAPKSDFKEVVTFGNGSALRFWKIFSGWTKEDWGGKFASEEDFLGNEIRPRREGHILDTVRLTHRFGLNVKLSYVPLEGAKTLGLTGQYATRNDCVLGRLSSAVPTSVKERFTPALSTKFFVDGASESQVLIAQHDIGGQSWQKDENGQNIIDNNFYSKYLSNRLSFEKGNLAGVGAFSRFFYTAQYFSRHIFGLDYVFDPRELQANHLAEMDVTGKTIENPKGPRFIWTVAPSPAVREEFRRKAQGDLDFRRHFLALNGKVQKGEDALFLIYGSDTWTYEPEKEATLIGKFVINSDFVASEAADIRLFFKHSIQFHKLPETLGQENPYTQDYPVAQWGDKLFTSDCNLGIKEKEVYPRDIAWVYNRPELEKFANFKDASRSGTFLVDATVNPAEVRFSRDHEWCLAKILKDRAASSIEELFKKL